MSKYRPFKTIKEFKSKFKLGTVLRIRRKDELMFATLPFTNYKYLGNKFYRFQGSETFSFTWSFQELFDLYEWQDENNKWLPFGVKE